MPLNSRCIGNKKHLNSFTLTSEGLAGIIRCRAEAGGQRRHRGDGKPAGTDRPLEKGVGGIEISKSPQRQPCCRLQWLRLSTFSAAGRLTEFFRETKHHQMPAEEQRSGGPALWCARRPDVPPWKGDRGNLTSRHQTTGRVRVFATANTWRTQRPRGASGFGTESQ